MTRYWRGYAAGAAVMAASLTALVLAKPISKISPQAETICVLADSCGPASRDISSSHFNPGCGYCGDLKRQPSETRESCPIDFTCGNGKLDSGEFAAIVKTPKGYKYGVVDKEESCDPLSLYYCPQDCHKEKPVAISQSASSRCGPEMSEVKKDGKQFCIDKWEGSLEYPDGTQYPYYKMPPNPIGELKAVSKKGVFPQVQMSLETAKQACGNAGKRLCEYKEWMSACLGNTKKAAYPWGGWNEVPGKCNYDKQGEFQRKLGVKSPPLHLFSRCNRGKRVPGSFFDEKIDPDGTLYHNGNPIDLSQYPKCSSKKDEMYVWNHTKKLFWDERLAQIHVGMEETGSYPECTSEFQVYDMIGSVNELVATLSAKGKAQFKGGYFLDATQNKPGCMYTTAAHETDYRDYSVGFRCCKD